MRYYCPGCWHDFPEDLPRCPDCGLDIHRAQSEKDYVEKLILALNHPEKSTPIRAAFILGEMREVRAVGPLISLVEHAADVYIAKAAAEALAKIGSLEAVQFLESLLRHDARMVRELAKAAMLRTMGARDFPGSESPTEECRTSRHKKEEPHEIKD